MYLPEKICYFNGEFIKESEIPITPLDHILRGFGVFDVARTFKHIPFFWREHIDRLYNSMRCCHIDPGMTQAEIYQVHLEVLKRNEKNLDPGDDFVIIPLVTGGTKEYYMGPSTGPTILINCEHLSPRYALYAKHYRDGIHFVVVNTRQYPPEALSSQVKHCSRLNLYLADYEAKMVDPQAWALLLDCRGFIAEGIGSNVLWVKDGALFLPTPDNILPGVTQGVVLRLAKELGIEIHRGNYTVYDLHTADEVFIVSTTPGVLPVSKFNGRVMPEPVWGTVTKRLFNAYCELVRVNLIERVQQVITYEKAGVK